jgi:hypothetical protein
LRAAQRRGNPRRKKASTSFLKKRSKKLLLLVPPAPAMPRPNPSHFSSRKPLHPKKNTPRHPTVHERMTIPAIPPNHLYLLDISKISAKVQIEVTAL